MSRGKKQQNQEPNPPLSASGKVRAEFREQFIEDITYWALHDPRLLLRLMRLVQEIQKTPFHGTGKPKLPKHDYAGCWSRRLTDEHRIVYEVQNDVISFIVGRWHHKEP